MRDPALATVLRLLIQGVGAARLAGVATRYGQAERAARLFGIADALSEKTGAGVSWPVLRSLNGSLNERDLAITREMLDREAFGAAWEEGRTMTIEQAVAYALSTAELREG